MNYNKPLGNDQYPITIVKTNNMLINHKCYINKNKKQDHKHPKANNNKEDKEYKETTPLLFVKMKGIFYCCRKMEHKYLY